jgi:hypothetical protein
MGMDGPAPNVARRLIEANISCNQSLPGHAAMTVRVGLGAA